MTAILICKGRRFELARLGRNVIADCFGLTGLLNKLRATQADLVANAAAGGDTRKLHAKAKRLEAKIIALRKRINPVSETDAEPNPDASYRSPY